MEPLDKQAILELYVSIMSEIKARLQVLSLWSQPSANLPRSPDKVADFPETVLAESCYLQIRRITELAALAILAAHNEDPQYRTKELTKKWGADDLLGALSKIEDSAMPEPIFTDLWADERPEHIVSKGIRDVPGLLGKIYREAGDKLHSGHLRFIASQRDKHYSFDFIRTSIASIVELFDRHILILPSGHMLTATLHWGRINRTDARWISAEWPDGLPQRA